MTRIDGDSNLPIVTQADRDAAADYTSNGGKIETVYHKGIRSGHYDHPLAHAFARHRIASTTEAAELTTELVEALHRIEAQAVCVALRHDPDEADDWLHDIANQARIALAKAAA